MIPLTWSDNRKDATRFMHAYTYFAKNLDYKPKIATDIKTICQKVSKKLIALATLPDYYVLSEKHILTNVLFKLKFTRSAFTCSKLAIVTMA